jgi:hypothetical protein
LWSSVYRLGRRSMNIPCIYVLYFKEVLQPKVSKDRLKDLPKHNAVRVVFWSRCKFLFVTIFTFAEKSSQRATKWMARDLPTYIIDNTRQGLTWIILCYVRSTRLFTACSHCSCRPPHQSLSTIRARKPPSPAHRTDATPLCP